MSSRPGSLTEKGSAATTTLVHRFYDELWNRWQLDLADEILAPTVSFRGSLGSEAQGRRAFLEYVARIREAFPDWHNHVHEIVGDGTRAAARLTWTGTHTGRLDGRPPTGRPVSYVGAAFFVREGAVLSDIWVVGDTREFWHSLEPEGSK